MVNSSLGFQSHISCGRGSFLKMEFDPSYHEIVGMKDQRSRSQENHVFFQWLLFPVWTAGNLVLQTQNNGSSSWLLGKACKGRPSSANPICIPPIKFLEMFFDDFATLCLQFMAVLHIEILEFVWNEEHSSFLNHFFQGRIKEASEKRSYYFLFFAVRCTIIQMTTELVRR